MKLLTIKKFYFLSILVVLAFVCSNVSIYSDDDVTSAGIGFAVSTEEIVKNPPETIKQEPYIPKGNTIGQFGRLPMTNEIISSLLFVFIGWFLVLIVFVLYIIFRDKKETERCHLK